MKKIVRPAVLLVAFFLLGACLLHPQTVNAKKSSYITNKKYIGTYGYKGREGSFEEGWYYLIINKITKSGKIRFALDYGGMNGSPLYYTGPLTAVVKGNKAQFVYTDDGWGNQGKGTIVFRKNGNISLTVKETFTEEFNRSTLARPKTVYKKVSDEHKLYGFGDEGVLYD